MIELQGRNALITGAAQGLGLAIARLFVERGARVMLADIDEAGAASAADELGPQARFVPCDVTRSADWVRAVEAATAAFGGLDTLVNNAGIEIVKPLFDQSEEGVGRLMSINVMGVFLGMKHSLGALAASGKGAVVNISSLAGTNGVPLFGSYAASKSAVILAQSLFVSEATVKWHLHNIFAKLGVRNRTSALARAQENSLP
ncbi:SDR family NAD(P)-dependent oxidoreductase [Cupriavidus sp. 2MCAB6]|uniref:SDR family NAD(P)-dependent oxidoreductase n=1 Tax=Cupriavidus sp. 2MCAB6 TaxID=3232981 RepID=UPI003F902D7A